MEQEKLQAIIERIYRELKDQIKEKIDDLGLNTEDCILKEEVHTRRLYLEWERYRSKPEFNVCLDVARLWLQRFVALRFMEANNYLPSGVRIFSNVHGKFEPEILEKVDRLDLPGLDHDMVETYRQNKDRLYRYLFLVQCRALHSALPMLFEEENDIFELLLPDDLLNSEALETLVNALPDEVWKDPSILLQLIDWEAFYENNNGIYDSNFIPDWSVCYLAENAIGHKWLDAYPDEELQRKWAYYLEEAQQEKRIRATITAAPDKIAALTSLTVFDPCACAGRTLLCAFDVLMDIYESCDVAPSDAARSILENNLFGLDVSQRAVQMACFALMMKARAYDPEIFSTGIRPQIYEYAYDDAKELMDSMKLAWYQTTIDQNSCGFAACLDLRETFPSVNGEAIFMFFSQLREYGPFFKIEEEAKVEDLRTTIALLYECIDQAQAKGGYFPKLVHQHVLPIIQMLDLMTRQYDVVISEGTQNRSGLAYGNYRYDSIPGVFRLEPYLGSHYYYEKKHKKIKSQFLYYRILTHYLKPEGTTGHASTSWLEKPMESPLRYKIYTDSVVYSCVELVDEAYTYEGYVNNLLWISRKVPHLSTEPDGYRSIQVCVNKFIGEEAAQFLTNTSHQLVATLEPDKEKDGKVLDILMKCSDAFTSTLGYSDQLDSSFLLTTPMKGEHYWFEMNRKWIITDAVRSDYYDPIWSTSKLWIPSLVKKSGSFRKWYGNDCLVAIYPKEGSGYSASFREGLHWKVLSTGNISFRYIPSLHKEYGIGTSFLASDWDFDQSHTSLMLATAFSNSCVASMLLDLWSKGNEEARYSPDNVSRLPVGEPIGFGDDTEARETWRNTMIQHAETAIALSRADWDESELSWDYSGHPMVDLAQPQTIEDAYRKWQQACEERFFKLKKTEETINDLYIKNYQLEDMLTPTVEERDVSVYRIFDTTADIPESMAENDYIRTKRDAVVSLLSHAVGCLFGRYSLDEPGIVFAGGQFKKDRYTTIAAKADNVFVIHSQPTNDKNDLMNNFEHWLSCVYGEAHLEDSLQFIADALGGEGDARTIIRTYFAEEFYLDHCTQFKGAPFYWLFEGTKKAEFKALIYMQRYHTKNTFKNIAKAIEREQKQEQKVLQKIEKALPKADKNEQKALNKEKKHLEDRQSALNVYAEKIAKLAEDGVKIDRDAGVQQNIKPLSSVLAKITTR